MFSSSLAWQGPSRPQCSQCQCRGQGRAFASLEIWGDIGQRNTVYSGGC